MVIFLHQQITNKNEKNSIDFLKKIANELNLDYKIIIIGEINEKIDSKIFKIKGSNIYREFSSWEKGLKYLGDEEFEILIISNETFFSHRAFDKYELKAHIEAFKSILEKNYPCASGDLAEILSSPPYYNSNSNKFISTYLMGLNKYIDRKTLSFLKGKEFFKELENQKNEISVIKKYSKYKNYEYIIDIENHLYLDGVANKWYKHSKLKKENYEMMKLKLGSIILEHHFSQYLIANNVELVDYKKFIERKKYIIYFILKLKWVIKKYARIY